MGPGPVLRESFADEVCGVAKKRCSVPRAELCGAYFPLRTFTNGLHPKDWTVKSFLPLLEGESWNTDLVATNFDVGIIADEFNWALLGLKSFSIDLCLSKEAEGFIYNISYNLGICRVCGEVIFHVEPTRAPGNCMMEKMRRFCSVC